MDREIDALGEIERQISKSIPGYCKRQKKNSLLMHIVSRLFFFNKDFMTDFYFPIGTTLYVPEGYDLNPGRFSTDLAHEWVHLLKIKRRGTVVHAFLYLFPQVLSLLSLLSFLAVNHSGWWLLNALWLLCLLPLPAPFRMQEELDCYTMDMAVFYWKTKTIPTIVIEDIAYQFYGANYFYMWPWYHDILRKLFNRSAMIRKGRLDDVSPYKEIKHIIEEKWNVSA